MLLIRNAQQHSDFKKYSHAKLLIWRSQKPKSKSWVFFVSVGFCTSYEQKILLL